MASSKSGLNGCVDFLYLINDIFYVTILPSYITTEVRITNLVYFT